MDKKHRASYIMAELNKLYSEPLVFLDHFDAYSLLIAVLLSAQSTDKKVNEITPNLFRLAPTVQQMAALPVETIKEAIKQIGLSNTKAKNIKALSQILIEKHQGKVPENMEALEALPGVGHKTASVVMAQAFGVPTFPVDTHIHRMMARWGLSSGKNVKQTEQDAKKVFPKKQWNQLHLQIIAYARAYSPARGSLEQDYITKAINKKRV